MTRIKWKKYIKACLLFSVVATLVSLLMSTYLVENMERHIVTGTLDSLNIDYDDEGNIRADADGVDIGVYEHYQVAMMYGDSNRFLVANNGIVFKTKVFSTEYHYVIDFNWLPSGEYNHDEIVDYVSNNKMMQVLRTGYLSGGIMLALFVYPVWLLVGVYLTPLLLVVVSWLYVKFRVYDSYGGDKEQVVRMRKLTRSQFLHRLNNRYNDSLDIYIVTCMYSLFMGVTFGYSHDITSILTVLVGIYTLLCIAVSVYYAVTEYVHIDLDRLKKIVESQDS